MKRFIPYIICLLLFTLSACNANPSGGSSVSESTPSDSLVSEPSAPDSVPDSLPEDSSVSESSEDSIPAPVIPPSSDAFTWITQPTIPVDMMLPIRDADRPGYFSPSSSICFIEKGLMGLMDPSGQVLLPAEYVDICYSRSQGGLIALKDGSTVYKRLNNQYQEVFDVEYDPRQLTAETVYLWDAQNHVILDTSNANAVYGGDEFVVVRESADSTLYAVGNADGLSTDFSYTGFGPTGLIGQFYLQDDIGWHLVSPSGDDLLMGFRIQARLQRQFSLNRDKSASITYIEAAPYPCSEGIYTLQNAENNLWGFYDASGKAITDCIFEDACPVSLGRAWVQWNGFWGLIELNLGVSVG